MSDYISGLSMKCLKTQRLCALLSQDPLGHLPPFEGCLFRRHLAFVLVTSASRWKDTFGCSLG